MRTIGGRMRFFPRFDGQQCTSAYGAILRENSAVVSWFSGKPWFVGEWHTFPDGHRLVTDDDIAIGFPPQQQLERGIAAAPAPRADAYNLPVVLHADGGVTVGSQTVAGCLGENATASEMVNPILCDG